MRRLRGIGAMNFGQIGSLAPLSAIYGFDRGTPIDRYYIESFLQAHAGDISGRVLELVDDHYSKRFGGSAITRQDILDLDARNPRATIIGDLTSDGTLPTAEFDCIILTQTLQLIFDLQAAVTRLRRALRPGGVLLVTVPGITPVDRNEWSDRWYWSMTGPALSRLLSSQFRPDRIAVKVYGNLHAATAFLHGAAVEEVSKARLDFRDPAYPVTVAARAVA